MNVFVALIDI